MDDNINSKRIAKNTILLYMRMLFLMVISLYTSRVVLNTLGVSDYGIYNVVGGIVAMLCFINSSLASATQRFITFTLGKGDTDKLSKIFSTSILTHAFLSVIILVLAETIGLWFFYAKMQIPYNRLNAAFWVYQCSIVTSIILILSVPYNAVIIAHEHINAFAYISILEVSLKLLIVYLLHFGSFDKLIMYAILIVCVQLITRFSYSIYCSKHFKETKFTYIWDKGLFKEITSFAGWSIFGNLASVLSSQGLNILLNIFFGPVINAAKGISNQVQFSLNELASNFQTALNPQITKTYSVGDLKEHYKLLIASSKYSALLLMLLSIPVISEADQILHYWLGEVPEHTVNFVRLSLIVAIFDSTTNSLVISAQATGKIKYYQIFCGSTLLLILPVSYMVLKLINIPEVVLFVQFIFVVLTQCVRLSFLHRMINLNVCQYLGKVYIPIFTCFILSIILPVFINILYEETVLRLIINLGVSFIVTSIIIYTIGLKKAERAFVLKGVNKIKKKILGK